MPFRLQLVLGLVIYASAAFNLHADVPRNDAAQVPNVKLEKASFSNVIKRIREAAAADDWKEPVLEETVKGWTADAARLTGHPRPALPAGFDSVRPSRPGDRLAGALCITSGNVSMGFVENSIILVDGNVKLSFVKDSVIVARGAVYIAHGSRNVVMAGQYIHVSHDGSGADRDQTSNGSLLVSGGVLDVAHASGSVCSAPLLVRISHANGATFAQSPNVEAGGDHRAPNRELARLDVRSIPGAVENPLEGKIKLVQVARGGEAGKGALAIFERDGVELVARIDKPLTDGTGKAIPELEGWRLTFVADSFAIFSADGTDAGFYVPRK